MDLYADIVVNSDAITIDKPFSYKVRENLRDILKLGHRVRIPFGNGNKTIEGFVFNIYEEEKDDNIRYKYIVDVCDPEPLLNRESLILVEFLRRKYLCKYIDAIRVMIPPKIMSGNKERVKQFKDLGLIIVDEEHESSYKSEMSPRYNTIEVCEFIKGLKDCKVVLGSATPSLDSYYKALKKDYDLVELTTRIGGKPLPKVDIVDMREELRAGNKAMLSRALYKKIKEKLSKKEQIILFLNRRGYSSFVSCRSCGFVYSCESCDISMTYHHNGFLICHYCGKTKKIDRACPKCQSKYLKHFGTGTEKVEMAVKHYFPEARVLRMDVDTTRKKNSHEELYNSFKNGDADILVGTQMIAKGLDFENVTLVGVLAADLGINFPDYRASERSFQILTQVSGRAGRADKEGEVIIQTYSPENYSLNYAKTGDYDKFFKEEIMIRKAMDYPPFSKLMLINLSSKFENELITFSKKLCSAIKFK